MSMILMNSENSKASDVHRLILDLQRGDNCVTLSSIFFLIFVNRTKKKKNQ